MFDGAVKSMDDSIPCLDERSPKPKVPHCSTFPMKGCLEKPEGFACDCSISDVVNLNSLISILFLCWIFVHYIMLGLFSSILIRI